MTAKHLANDAVGLSDLVALVHSKVIQVERLLTDVGYNVIFCAADGVVAYKEDTDATSAAALYTSIAAISGTDFTFSAGVGHSLREAYVALLAAKSNGKAHVCIFSDMTCSEL